MENNENVLRSTEKIEKQEVEPKLNFRILYGAHESPDDFKNLEKELRNVDIYFPENAGWQKNSELAYQAYATGQYEVPEDMHPVVKPELETLARLGREGKVLGIGLIDIPEDHPLLESFYAQKELVNRAMEAFESGEFEKAIQGIKEAERKEAELDREREQYITEQARLKVDEIITKYPAIKEKAEREGELKILLTLGAAHTGVSHGLKKQGETVSRKFSESTFVFTPFHSLNRRYIFNKKVDDDHAAKALLSLELVNSSYSSGDMNAIAKRVTSVATQFSLEDIRKISAQLGLGRPIDAILNGLKRDTSQ